MLPPLSPKILVVDDKSANLFTMRQLLSKLPITLIEADSGITALAHTLDHQFCLAIIDVQMPEMDGYELVSLLRGNRATASLPVIFVSAIYSDEYHHQKGYDAGAVDFLSKPFIPEILISKVTVFLNLYEQQQAIEQANAHIKQLNEELEDRVVQRTAELEQAYDTLSQTDRNTQDLITNLTQTLQPPLVAIDEYAQSALALPLNQQQQQQLSQITTATSYMQTLINNMTALIRFEKKQVQLNLTDCNLKDLLTAVQTHFQSKLTTQQVVLELENITRLPAIEADNSLLLNLFCQLVHNALKHTPPGGFILISGYNLSHQTPPTIAFQIQDTGVGIAPEHHEKIFAKFYRITSSALPTDSPFENNGAGIGLTLAQAIVTLHDGRIWAESAGYDNRTFPGTIFHIHLPCA